MGLSCAGNRLLAMSLSNLMCTNDVLHCMHEHELSFKEIEVGVTG